MCKAVAENAVLSPLSLSSDVWFGQAVSFSSVHRLAQTGTAKVIVLRVAVDLVAAAAGCHWGSRMKCSVCQSTNTEQQLASRPAVTSTRVRVSLLRDNFDRTPPTKVSKGTEFVATCSPFGVLARRRRVTVFLVALFRCLQPFW